MGWKVIWKFSGPIVNCFQVTYIHRLFNHLQIFVGTFYRASVMKSVVQVQRFSIQKWFQKAFGIRQNLLWKVAILIYQLVYAAFSYWCSKNGVWRENCCSPIIKLLWINCFLFIVYFQFKLKTPHSLIIPK